MPHRSAETATYPGEMAKVELEILDDLLEFVDGYAHNAEESRDEFLHRIISEEIDRCHEKLRKELEDLWASHPIDLGGKTAAELIREDRDHRDDKRFGPDGHAR
jgi:hypothetical protein